MLRRVIAAMLGRGRDGPIEGTIADRLLQADVRRILPVAMRANAERRGDPPPSADWRVVKVDVLAEPALSEDGTRVVGPWVERWTIDSARSPAQAYTVTFTPDERGETDFSIETPDRRLD